LCHKLKIYVNLVDFNKKIDFYRSFLCCSFFPSLVSSDLGDSSWLSFPGLQLRLLFSVMLPISMVARALAAPKILMVFVRSARFSVFLHRSKCVAPFFR
jgi:hypothetical protein